MCMFDFMYAYIFIKLFYLLIIYSFHVSAAVKIGDVKTIEILLDYCGADHTYIPGMYRGPRYTDTAKPLFYKMMT